MEKRPLGKTGIEVSEVAFGCVEIGIPYGIGIENQNDMLPEKDAIDLLHEATNSGINFFDTARSYGDSESIIGKAFKGMRKEIVLSTKSEHFQIVEGRLPNRIELTKIIVDSLHQSLKALQTDYVDVFMLHTSNIEVLENDDISSIFSNLKKSGIARTIGVSTYLPEQTKKALDIGIWDVIQLPFNLMNQSQQSLFSLASQRGVGLIIRSVLLKGLLSKRGKNLHPALKDVENHIAFYNELLNKTVPDLPTLATKFALSFDEVSAILIGIDKMEYLNKSLKAANGNYLNKKELKRACEMSYPDPAFLNLHEWNKEGWLK